VLDVGPVETGACRTVLMAVVVFISSLLEVSSVREAKRQVLADEQWRTVQHEDTQNDELLALSKQILDLTTPLHTDARARESTRA
jgi:uncharacterized membrane protein